MIFYCKDKTAPNLFHHVRLSLVTLDFNLYQGNVLSRHDLVGKWSVFVVSAFLLRVLDSKSLLL